MKRKLGAIILMVVLVLALAVPMAAVGANPGPGIVGLWHFDEGTGTIASDSSGNGNHGTVSGATWTSGIFDGALSFDGVNDYVEVDHAIAATIAITMEAWVKVDASISTDFEVISKWDGVGNGVIHFEIAPDLKVRMTLRHGTGISDYIVNFYSTEALPADQWVHVAEVWNGTTATIYFDGVAKGSQSGSGTIRHNSSMKYWIGSAYGTMRFFDGMIDEVRIWDEALTAGTLPYGEITSPDVDEVIFGSTDFEALYYDDDPGIVQWAVRQDDPNVGSKTVFGNVNGHNDTYSWDGYSFQATADTSGWTPDDYYFVFNPKEETGEQDVRLIRHFYVGSLGDLTPTPDYNPVGTDHTVSVGIGVEVAGVEVWFDINGPNSSESDSTTTDGSGVATFTYTGDNPGTDTITAFIDLDGQGDLDVDEPTSTNTATKDWVVNFITGGGKLNRGTVGLDGKLNKPAYTFAGTVGYLPDMTLVGQFQIVDHTGKGAYTIHLNSFSSLVFTGGPTGSPPATYNTATFTGSGWDNQGTSIGPITLRITDIAEPGKGSDKIEVWVGTWVSFTIDGGNFQVHDGYTSP